LRRSKVSSTSKAKGKPGAKKTRMINPSSILLNNVRSHWGIENRLHWVLDIAFDEDSCCIRKENGPENFAILRHIALNLLKHEKTSKQRSIRGKRLLAGWDETYLLKVLAGLLKLV